MPRKPTKAPKAPVVSSAKGASHFLVRRDGKLVQLVERLPDEPPIGIDLEGDEPYTSEQRVMYGRLTRELQRHYYGSIKERAGRGVKIVRPKPIPPGAHIARGAFDNGEVWELDAAKHLLNVIEQQARRNEYLNRRLTSAKRAVQDTNEKRRAKADARDLAIWRDHGMLLAILDSGDTALLKRVLTRWKVPFGLQNTFKKANVKSTLARRHRVTRPTVDAALEKMKRR
jgi:hypothetical protein